MQMIGRWRTLALARFLRGFFAADSESLITDSRTLMAGCARTAEYSRRQKKLISITIKYN